MGAELQSRNHQRRIAIVQNLRKWGWCKARTLAVEVGACERTIYRDIAILKAYGVPIKSAAGDGLRWVQQEENA